jgi:hypothetical protein
VAFDFWNERLMSVFNDRLRLRVPPHDTRVLYVHPIAQHPQYLGTSRHISGAFSRIETCLDEAQHILSGSSQGIRSEAYTIWIYVPQPENFLHIHASANGTKIPSRSQFTDNLLAVSFEGQTGPVTWSLAFRW